MIFTAQPLPAQQTSSREFQSYGASNLAPCPPSDARIMSIPATALEVKNVNVYSLRLAGMMRSYNNKEDVIDPLDFSDLFSVANPKGNFLFPIPQSVTSFKNATESTLAKVEELGFKKTSRGRYAFYQGSSDPDTIMQVCGLGGEMYAYAPQNRTSFAGAMTATIMRRLIFAALKVASPNNFSPTLEAVEYKEIKEILYDPSKWDLKDNKADGHFLPYFDGLTTPDYATAGEFISLFLRSLGKNGSKRTTSTTLILRGWPSLSNTSTGKIISHMVFCLRVGTTGGFAIRPIYRQGIYCGMVLIGQSSILANTKLEAPVSAEQLVLEVSRMSSHDTVVAKIAELLSDSPLRDEDDKSPIDPTKLTTPRKVHYAAYRRKVSSAVQAEINKLLPQLRFRQVFLRPLDNGDLLTAMVAMEGQELLDDNAPFDLLGGNLFTTSKTLSTLSAFGTVAPSPMYAEGSNTSQVIRPGAPIEKGTSKGTLEGFPIFGRPIQQAVEDWKTLKKTGAISYKVNGKNAYGFARIANVGTYVRPSDREGAQVIKLVQKYSGFKKAARKHQEVDAGAADEGPQTKRSRDAKTSNLEQARAMFADLGWGAPAHTEAQEEDFMDDD